MGKFTPLDFLLGEDFPEVHAFEEEFVLITVFQGLRRKLRHMLSTGDDMALQSTLVKHC